MPGDVYEGWLTDGNVWSTQDGTIFIKPNGMPIPFQWLGNCSMLEDGTDTYGSTVVTRKRNPNGGVGVHSIYQGAGEMSSVGLVIKKLQYDRKKSELRRCWWVLDDREMCGGIGADYWNQWREIKRYCYGRFTERTDLGTSIGNEDPDERTITLPFSSIVDYTVDLYRLTGEIDSTTGSVMMVDVAAFQPERCPDGCDDQEACIVMAITETDVGNSYVVPNYNGGALNSWGTPVALTAFGVQSATQIAGARQFGIVVSNGASSLIYTNDLFATQTQIQTTDMAVHAPLSVDLIDQSFVVVGGADGYVYVSRDSSQSYETVSSGGATTSDITRVMVSRSNPQVIYGVSSAGDVIIKSENGGRTWQAMTATGGGNGITALWIHPFNHNYVLVGTDAGEIYETTDGAVAWTEQLDLPGLTVATKPNTTIQDIVGCGCDSLGLITENSADDERLFYRNVDGGASGRWYQPPDGYEAVASGKSLNGLTCCDANAFIAVGGEAATDDLILFLA